MTEVIETSRSSTPLSVTSACRTLDIARSTFYRYRSYDPFVDTDVELRGPRSEDRPGLAVVRLPQDHARTAAAGRRRRLEDRPAPDA